MKSRTILIVGIAAFLGLGCSSTPAARTGTEAAPPESELLEFVPPPQWAVRPQPMFPERAFNQGIRQGEIVLYCRAKADGRVEKCEVLSENPPGAGFREEGLKAAEGARLAPEWVTQAGVGGDVIFMVTWRIAE